MFQIFVNGDPMNLEKSPNLAVLLRDLGYDVDEGGFAVAINQHFVPKTEYEKTQIKANDNIEIVIPMQGG